MNGIKKEKFKKYLNNKYCLFSFFALFILIKYLINMDFLKIFKFQ